MKLKLRHQLKDGRFVEIEGEPKAIVDMIQELDRSFSMVRPDLEAFEKASDSPRVAIESMIASATRRQVRKKDLVDYLEHVERADMRHTIEELMMHFFGQIFSSDDDGSQYQNFYSMLRRAQADIERSHSGLWIGEWKREGDARYKEYRFQKNETLQEPSESS